MASKKKPRAGKTPGKTMPSTERIASSVAMRGANNSHLRISWRFGHFDWDGRFRFVDLDDFREVEDQLRQFETMTINELFHRAKEPGKRYSVAELPCPEALDRLEAIGLADQDEIYRLRLSGTKRLYGFLVDTVFHLVFWDPDHEVWPSEKKHT